MTDRSNAFLVVPAAVVALLSASAPTAQACSCARLTADQVAAGMAVLFEGEVIGSRRTGEAGQRQITTLRVVRPIKGVTEQIVDIESGVVSAACGYTFDGDLRGKVIGADRDARGVLTTNLCAMMLLNQQQR